MAYTIHIRDNETKMVYAIRECGDWDDGAEFWWTDGNGACDCNLGKMIGRVGVECGDAQFAPIKAVLDDGTEVKLSD